MNRALNQTYPQVFEPQIDTVNIPGVTLPSLKPAREVKIYKQRKARQDKHFTGHTVVGWW